jgi:hypothetical protein
MRVVVCAEKNGNDGIIFELAESTSASDIPSAHKTEEKDIGPRTILVKYPNSYFQISEQIPLVKRLIDREFVENRDEKTYVIGRHRGLEKIWQKL